jgi:proteasome assembly chaperone (PAC2) family protein
VPTKRDVIITERPDLRQPLMVCGINGWVDGGEASTGTVQYLMRKLKAKQFAEIPVERFHVFQVPGQTSMRPQVRMENGIIKEHSFPQNKFSYWLNPKTNNDLIFFLGTEPNTNWKSYAESILSVVKEFSVVRLYLLGGVLDKTPHTKDPAVSCACSSPELKEELKKYGIEFSNYEGPGSFGTTLLYYCQKRRIPMVSMTARATFYPEYNIIISYNAKSVRALVKRLTYLLGLRIDTSDLDKQSDEFETKLTFMASHNPEFQSYVAELEKEYTKTRFEEPLDISAAEAIQSVEEFLKRQNES